MSIEADLAYLCEWLGATLGKEVIHVHRLDGADPGAAVLLWPWALQDMPSHLRPRPAPDGRHPPNARRRILRALLLAQASDDLDALLRGIDERPIHETAEGRRLLVTPFDLAQEQLCALFVAAQAPLQLALPIEVASEDR